MRLSNRFQTRFLMLWHAVFSGAFIIAYVSPDVYAMHMFAGYLILAALAVRLIAGLFARPKSPMALPNPMAATRQWIDKISNGGKARNPLLAWISVALLSTIGLAAATGWVADILPFIEDLHEGLSEFTLVIIAGHLGFVFFKTIKKYLSDLWQDYILTPSQ